MKIVKFLMVCDTMVFIFPPIFLFFNAACCIAGVILFVYLCRTRQLAISRKIFFLIPHVAVFVIAEVHFGVYGWLTYRYSILAYTIAVIGLPFLLYCFLQVTDRYYAILAIILCFISLFFAFLGFVLIIGIYQ
jgi:hypothetical protein